jgi:chromodomain-helicase-DNA-binding protein 4
MSEGGSDDLARLFTPPRTPTSSALSEVPKTPSPLPKARQREIFYVEPPILSAVEKSQYKHLPPQFLISGVESPDIDQVIGQYREGTDLYYFARFKDGIAHKVCDLIFDTFPIKFHAFISN